jgi:hypothetical protein
METYDNTHQQLIKETEIESRISMAKLAFNKKKALFTSKLNLQFRKKLVNCYIQSTRIVKLGHFGK